VYQITDTPIIRSLGVQLELDPLRERNRVTYINDVQGSEFELPWAFDANSPIREALNASAIKTDDLDAVVRDLVTVADDCLLFLRHLVSIEIAREGKLIKRVNRRNVDDHRVTLSFSPNERREHWYVIRADAEQKAAPLREKYPAIERLARQTDIQIAFNLSKSDKRLGKLFAYLPTEQDSPVPCHINGDFFPEQNRKALVLSGEQHERHWNEMLLNVAATEIARHLLQLRDVLGYAGLWRLMGEAFEHRNSPHFENFWIGLSEAAGEIEVVWGAGERWITPENSRIAPRETTESEERSLNHIGVNIVHRDLGPYQNALQTLGARRLSFEAIVDALELWDKDQLDDDVAKGTQALDSLVRPLWTITDSLAGADAASNKIGRALVMRLRTIRLAPEPDGMLAPIDSLYRLPSPITSAQLDKYFSGLPVVLESFRQFPTIYSLIDILSFERLLVELAARIDDEDSAKEFFGSDPKQIRGFYRFLSDYPRAEGYAIDISSISNTPLLAGHNRFLTPTTAVLPGGFKDPVGRFNTLDISFYDDRAQDFLKEVLNVRTLTFESYIQNHLSGILSEGISDNEYVALFDEMIAHATLLGVPSIQAVLRNLRLVKTMDGGMHLPRECYFRTTELADLLGDQRSLWVSTTLFPAFKRDLAKVFLERLGMRSRPTLDHALDRVDDIVHNPPSEAQQRAIANVIHLICQICEDDNVANREHEFVDEIKRLRTTKWLPASRDGQFQTSTWYAPCELYQLFRAPGFDSQVLVLSVRQNPRMPLTSRFLALLEMPAEPETSVVVSHLIHCSETGVPPNELTYQILNERVQKKDNLFSLEKLKRTPCVYSPAQRRFFGTDRIFWSKPHIRRYCFQASNWMHRYKELFDFLGVQEEPNSNTYAGVLQEITKEFGGHAECLPMDIQLIHEMCLEALARGFREDPSDTRDLLEKLLDYPFLITQAGTLAFADEVAINDSDWLAEPFGDELAGRLVKPSPEYREVIDHLELKMLSGVTHLEAVRLGEVISDEEASEKIGERRDLLLWLFSGLKTEARSRILEALNLIQVSRSDLIQVRSVFSLSDPPVVSTPKSEQVLFERDTNRLYLHLDLGTAYWIPALRSVFSTLIAGEDGIDVRQCALSASSILLAPSYDQAQRQLEQAGFARPLGEHTGQIEFGDASLGEISNADVETKGSVANPPASGISAGPHDSNTGSAANESTGIAAPGSSLEEKGPGGQLGTPGDEREATNRQHGQREGTGDGRAPSTTPGSGAKRTQWMRSYVVPKSGEKSEQSSQSEGQQERNVAIDEAAMNAVITYEGGRQCAVERMPHLNPGFDLISRSKSLGEKRLIEVKGLASEWTERGVKLTRTQIMNAEEYGDEYWLYVVEHALDPNNRNIHAIQNPFFKADEFWFDYVWRDLASEHGSDLRSRFAPGRKVKVHDWGVGTIVDIQHRGIASNITIDFPIHGKRNLPFNVNGMEVVDE
jgi:Protein NO VEIN, C-terminal